MTCYETKQIDETLDELKTSKNGLKRLEADGKNELKEKKKKSWIKIFLGELNDPMIFVLFAAIAVTIGVSIYDTIKVIKEGGVFSFISTGDWPDVIIILAVILINALIGTIQEIKAMEKLDLSFPLFHALHLLFHKIYKRF